MFYFQLKCITPCMRTFWHEIISVNYTKTIKDFLKKNILEYKISGNRENEHRHVYVSMHISSFYIICTVSYTRKYTRIVAHILAHPCTRK